MEGFKIKYVFFMIVLVLSAASIAAVGVNYIAKGGNVFDQMEGKCSSPGNTDIVISAETLNIALIPKTEWDTTANKCGYESIACTDCSDYVSYSIIVVGFSKGADADKIILPYDELDYLTEEFMDPNDFQQPSQITVTYTHQVY